MPTAESRLHWSIDYDTGRQRGLFGAALAATLRTWQPGQGGGTAVRRYDVLPNYSAGWSSRDYIEAEGGGWRIGKAEVARRVLDGGEAAYEVAYRNDTSGEAMSLRFQTNDQPLPEIQGAWSLASTNHAGDLHRAYRCEGSATTAGGARTILLQVNGTEVRSAAGDAAQPLVPWWALFDGLAAFAALATGGAPGRTLAERFTVLEDLQKPRPGCTLRRLDDEPVEVAGHRLRGYCLYGTGVLPTYWWLDETGVVCVASTTFQTLALAGASNQEHDS